MKNDGLILNYRSTFDLLNDMLVKIVEIKNDCVQFEEVKMFIDMTNELKKNICRWVDTTLYVDYLNNKRYIDESFEYCCDEIHELEKDGVVL